MKQEDISENDIIECWVDSPTLEEQRTQLTDVLTTLAQPETELTKPRLRLFKFTQFLINIVIKHLLNNNNTDFIIELKESQPEVYDQLKQIAKEIDESISESLLDDYTCVGVEIFDGDVVKIMVVL